ncbi:hypothetical protein V6Z72_14440 [Cereibacter sphaeroides]|uniref:hypothetical protein n=1 Tax=Cereibacter sphaeroides TaxID=1063 RepID=UPI00399082DB
MGKTIAYGKIGEIDRRIAELTGLREMLGHLVENCHGDANPAYPIIDGLSGRSRGSYRLPKNPAIDTGCRK